jgi:hypothetical protein
MQGKYVAETVGLQYASQGFADPVGERYVPGLVWRVQRATAAGASHGRGHRRHRQQRGGLAVRAHDVHAPDQEVMPFGPGNPVGLQQGHPTRIPGRLVSEYEQAA